MHAVLSLSSVHKRDTYVGVYDPRQLSSLDQQERFTLQQYTKAIHHLQPHLSSTNKSSTCTTLITCFVFICLELLCGHFATAQNHLHNGLKIIKERKTSPHTHDDVFLLDAVPNSVDDCIIKAFCRLEFQLELFRHSHQHPCLVLQTSELDLTPDTFHSINAAWDRLERLFSKIFHLTEQVRRHEQMSGHLFHGHSPSLLAYQQQIQTELSACLGILEASRKILDSRDPRGLACRVLFVYHTMASIMADTCLRLGDEKIYDSHTNKFVSILEQSTTMREIGLSESPDRPLLGSRIHMSRSIVDVGWIAPLYYTALKCRVRHVRLQAIRLIETTSYREGIWDSHVAACVARKVVEIEEGESYTRSGMGNDILPSSSLVPEDMALPKHPPSNRVNEVQLILPDGPTDAITLLYRQGRGSWEEVQVYIS